MGMAFSQPVLTGIRAETDGSHQSGSSDEAGMTWDWNCETPKTRQLDGGDVGEHCLIARRLVERVVESVVGRLSGRPTISASRQCRRKRTCTIFTPQLS